MQISMRNLAIIALTLMSNVSNAAPPHVAELIPPFFETAQNDVSVSGSVIVGITSTNARGGETVQSLQLTHIPSPKDDLVCLSMISRDGVYYSRNTFRLPKNSEGSTVQIPYKTAQLSRLGGYGRQDLAILASAGKCEERSTNGYFVLDAPAAKPPESIRVFINSFGATDVFYRMGGSGQPSQCSQIAEGRRTSFDYWCDIPWPQSGAEQLSLKIQRERYGRGMPAVELTLFLVPRK